MASGNSAKAYGKYVGDGVGPIPLKHGFQCQKIEIRSENGEAVWHEGMPGPWKNVDGADPSFLAAGVAPTEFGAEISGSDVVLNENGTTYYYAMY